MEDSGAIWSWNEWKIEGIVKFTWGRPYGSRTHFNHIVTVIGDRFTCYRRSSREVFRAKLYLRSSRGYEYPGVAKDD